jgi:hypothetical protein
MTKTLTTVKIVDLTKSKNNEHICIVDTEQLEILYDYAQWGIVRILEVKGE